VTDRLILAGVSSRTGRHEHAPRAAPEVGGQKVTAGKLILAERRHPLVQRLKHEVDGPRFSD
jgi:hypothetical protein